MTNIEELSKIFEDNSDKRICVLGTTCTGKTYLINATNMGLDMDKEVFPLLTQEETDYVCQTPWTEEIGSKMDELVRTKLSIKPGVLMFGTVLLDNGVYSMGIVIQDKYRGKGYSYLALKELEEVAFEKNDISELSDFIPEDRVNAISSFKKAGFVFSGKERIDKVFDKEVVSKEMIITRDMYFKD